VPFTVVFGIVTEALLKVVVANVVVPLKVLVPVQVLLPFKDGFNTGCVPVGAPAVPKTAFPRRYASKMVFWSAVPE